jgi:hypothetical protein
VAGDRDFDDILGLEQISGLRPVVFLKPHVDREPEYHRDRTGSGCRRGLLPDGQFGPELAIQPLDVLKGDDAILFGA